MSYLLLARLVLISFLLALIDLEFAFDSSRISKVADLVVLEDLLNFLVSQAEDLSTREIVNNSSGPGEYRVERQHKDYYVKRWNPTSFRKLRWSETKKIKDFDH